MTDSLPDRTDLERWRKVESLLDQALDRPPAERQAFIREQAGHAEELAREVESLLREIDKQGVLDEPISELLDEVIPSFRISEQIIGSWRLVKPLASGGMGRVFVAERADGDFQQRAALKLLRWEVADDEARARFRTERQILAGLDHPAIARLIDGGVTEEGHPFLVLELIDGLPIDTFCRRQTLSLRQRLGLFLQVCEAVRAAHAQLVIHRDLKPSNILVTKEGQIRLLDFGVSKILDEAGRETSPLTQGPLAPATPMYAAPEQLEGGKISMATDVYGLGMVLFELLTGRSPFKKSGSGPLDVARAVLETDAPPPSRALSADSPIAAKELRGDLDAMTLKALRKESDARYSSVESLASDVKAFLAGHPISARPPTGIYRVRKFVQRHRAASLLSLLIFAGAAASAWSITEQSRRAQREAARAQATADFLARTLTDANLRSDSAGDTSLLSLLERAEPRLNLDLADFPAERARVRRLLAQAFRGIGEVEKAAHLHRIALAEAEDYFGAESSEFAWALIGLAMNEETNGSSGQIEKLARARAIFEAAHGFRSEPVLTALTHLAEAYSHAEELEESEQTCRLAIELATELFGPEHPRAAPPLAILGSNLRRQERYEESIELLRRALALYVEGSVGVAMNALSIRNNLALALADAGRLDDAEEEYRRTLAKQREKLGDEHPDLGETLTNLGRLLMDRGAFREAEGPIREAAALIRSSLPPESFSRLGAELNLATLSLELGDLDGARHLATSVHGAFEERLGETHPATLITAWRIGEIERRRGRLDIARSWLEREPSASTPVDAVGFGLRQLCLARLEVDAGRPEAATEPLRQALSRYRRHLGADHFWTLEAEAEWAALKRNDLTPRVDELKGHLQMLREVLPEGNWRLARLERLLAESP